MNFDIKDMKSWANRHDVKIGDKGYFFNDIDDAKSDGCYCKPVRGIVEYIRDNYCYCFGIDKRGLKENYSFFLPLNAVKEDKPKEKKYRPFKTMRELTEVVRSKDWSTAINTGEELLLRRKSNKHRIKVLITRVEFDNNLELVSIDGETPKFLLENYEVMTVKGKFEPFGVEVKDD